MMDRSQALLSENLVTSVTEAAHDAVTRARSYLFDLQYEDGHWCAELESNTTITAEYVFLNYILGEIADPKYRERLEKRRDPLARYFFRNQKADGSWGIAWDHAGDLSTTTETYFALRIIGIPEDDPRMKRAEKFILAEGGIGQVRVLTRIQLAKFGLFPWNCVPVLLPEVMLIPSKFPINIYSFSSWARGTIVPLLVLFHHRPVFELPNGRSESNNWLDHLWAEPSDKYVPYKKSLRSAFLEDGVSWKTLFTVADRVTSLYDRLHLPPVRNHSMKKAVEWVKDRIEDSGDIAGIWPPMFYGTLALILTGHSPSEDPIPRMLEAIERFSIDDEDGFRVQSCVSPVWDTALAMGALLDAGEDPKSPHLADATRWLRSKQIFKEYGDWRVNNRKGPAGGWSFEYENTWYPDVDDTAAVIISLLGQDTALREDASIHLSIQWMLSMQNPDGGWAAFDVRNDKLFLNEIPFSDMNSLSDPSSADVTGRVLSALGVVNDPKHATVIADGIRYLRENQEPEGSWYGRWGVNYIYGTYLSLGGLAAHGLPSDDPTVRRGLDWLLSVQNADGGFGEGLESYRDRSQMGIGNSTASQTAWGLLGMLHYLPVHHEAVVRAVRWLTEQQLPNGTWNEEEFTGTGFPNHFYIRYHLYRHNFPLSALGRFRELVDAS